ncbi:hypothetical protein [Thermococcus sp. 21S7]|nr:hypothetical protein [Thermococcus sp. 21S7]
MTVKLEGQKVTIEGKLIRLESDLRKVIGDVVQPFPLSLSKITL